MKPGTAARCPYFRRAAASQAFAPISEFPPPVLVTHLMKTPTIPSKKDGIASGEIPAGPHGPMQPTTPTIDPLSHYVVTDPRGVALNGTNYPRGTRLDTIPCCGAQAVETWSYFGQIGLAPIKR